MTDWLPNRDYSADRSALYDDVATAFANDPLIQMLTPKVLHGLVRQFFNWAVEDDVLLLRMHPYNISAGMTKILDDAPLGWVGGGFKRHVTDVTIWALLHSES